MLTTLIFMYSATASQVITRRSFRGSLPDMGGISTLSTLTAPWLLPVLALIREHGMGLLWQGCLLQGFCLRISTRYCISMATQSLEDPCLIYGIAIPPKVFFLWLWSRLLQGRGGKNLALNNYLILTPECFWWI